jgi:hypothetical protein
MAGGCERMISLDNSDWLSRPGAAAVDDRVAAGISQITELNHPVSALIAQEFCRNARRPKTRLGYEPAWRVAAFFRPIRPDAASRRRALRSVTPSLEDKH